MVAMTSTITRCLRLVGREDPTTVTSIRAALKVRYDFTSPGQWLLMGIYVPCMCCSLGNVSQGRSLVMVPAQQHLDVDVLPESGDTGLSVPSQALTPLSPVLVSRGMTSMPRLRALWPWTWPSTSWRGGASRLAS